MIHARPRPLISLSSAVLLVLACGGTTAAEPGPVKRKLLEGYGNLPLSFEANEGQTDPAVKFLSRGPGYTLFLTSSEATLSLRQGKSGLRVLRMRIVGASPTPTVAGVEALPGKSNYFVGNDPGKWRKGVRTFAKVEYRNVYPGVNLAYYGKQRQLEYDFVLSPGADPKAIDLAFDGAEAIAIDGAGELVLSMGGGEVRMHKPTLYQQRAGKREPVAGRYVRRATNRVGFEVAASATHPPGQDAGTIAAAPLVLKCAKSGCVQEGDSEGVTRAFVPAPSRSQLAR